MSGLFVRFVTSTEAGRLYPRYDDESGIVAVESRVARDWPYGIDVGGSLICDLDTDHVLANFDLHIPRQHWSRGESVRWPNAQQAGNLVFQEATVRTKSFDATVEAIADPALRLLEIRIGDMEPHEAWALSETCVALASGDELAGFVLKLGGDESGGAPTP